LGTTVGTTVRNDGFGKVFQRLKVFLKTKNFTDLIFNFGDRLAEIAGINE